MDDRTEVVGARGCIFAVGAPVSCLAQSSLALAAPSDRSLLLNASFVTRDFSAMQTERDGSDGHHITLLSKQHRALLKPAGDTALGRLPADSDASASAQFDGRQPTSGLVRFFADNVLDDWVDLGTAMVSAEDHSNKAYFRALHWPTANIARQKLGLEAVDFHVTLGFKTADIHDSSKSAASSLLLSFDILNDCLGAIALGSVSAATPSSGKGPAKAAPGDADDAATAPFSGASLSPLPSRAALSSLYYHHPRFIPIYFAWEWMRLLPAQSDEAMALVRVAVDRCERLLCPPWTASAPRPSSGGQALTADKTPLHSAWDAHAHQLLESAENSRAHFLILALCLKTQAFLFGKQNKFAEAVAASERLLLLPGVSESWGVAHFLQGVSVMCLVAPSVANLSKRGTPSTSGTAPKPRTGAAADTAAETDARLAASSRLLQTLSTLSVAEQIEVASRCFETAHRLIFSSLLSHDGTQEKLVGSLQWMWQYQWEGDVRNKVVETFAKAQSKLESLKKTAAKLSDTLRRPAGALPPATSPPATHINIAVDPDEDEDEGGDERGARHRSGAPGNSFAALSRTVTNAVLLRDRFATVDPRQRVAIQLASPESATVLLPRNFSFVIPGVLAGMSIPKRASHVQALASIGIGLVVTLYETPLPSEWFSAGRIDNLFLALDNYKGPSLDQVDVFMKQAEDAIAKGKAVLCHCGGGKGRAGTYLACFLVKHGLDCSAETVGESAGGDEGQQPPKLSSAEAIRVLRELRPGSVETEEQERVIKAYSDLLWRRVS